MITLPDGRQAGFIAESGAPCPARVMPIDDGARAAVVLRRLEQGEVLLWTGDYLNGRKMLQALRRRLDKERGVTGASGQSLGERWMGERGATRRRGELLGNIVVAIEPSGEVPLRRAPATVDAVRWAWGASESPRLVALNTLSGALSAAEWTRKGLEVPGLEGSIRPRFGVFSPTRRAYVDLLEHLDVDGASVLDVGTGTGVLAFVLLQRGARLAVGTDMEERAIVCATENADALGLGERFRATLADLFPSDGLFDWIVFNAPWVPEKPRTGLDRAVFDENGETLRRFLRGVPERLSPGGSAALIFSDLPIRLGLREAGSLEAEFEAAGLGIQKRATVPATHGRSKNTNDPLHGARAAERIELYVLRPLG